MKRRVSMTLVFSLLLALTTTFTPKLAYAQQSPPRIDVAIDEGLWRFRADTGIVPLGEHQVLRFSTGWDVTLLFTASVWQINYFPGNCQGGVCKHISADPTFLGSVQLMPGEAFSIDLSPIPGASGVRAVMVGNRRNVSVTAAIINTLTNETVSRIIVANTDGDIY